MGSSAFAGNPLMIDLTDLGQRGWLGDNELRPDPGFQAGRVDFPLQFAFRVPRLRLAARHFFANAAAHERSDFEAFCAAERDWLPDYALFMTLDAEYPGSKWNQWPAALARWLGEGAHRRRVGEAQRAVIGADPRGKWFADYERLYRAVMAER